MEKKQQSSHTTHVVNFLWATLLCHCYFHIFYVYKSAILKVWDEKKFIAKDWRLNV